MNRFLKLFRDWFHNEEIIRLRAEVVSLERFKRKWDGHRCPNSNDYWSDYITEQQKVRALEEQLERVIRKKDAEREVLMAAITGIGPELMRRLSPTGDVR